MLIGIICLVIFLIMASFQPDGLHGFFFGKRKPQYHPTPELDAVLTELIQMGNSAHRCRYELNHLGWTPETAIYLHKQGLLSSEGLQRLLSALPLKTKNTPK